MSNHRIYCLTNTYTPILFDQYSHIYIKQHISNTQNYTEHNVIVTKLCNF